MPKRLGNNPPNPADNNHSMTVEQGEDDATGSMAERKVKANQLATGKATDGVAGSPPPQQTTPLASRATQPAEATQEDAQIKEKEAIIEECKDVYRQAASASTYNDFQTAANDGMKKIKQSLRKLKIETYVRDGWAVEYSLPLSGQAKAVEIKHTNHQISGKWLWSLSNDTQQFIASDEKQAVSIYADWDSYHPVLCIKSRNSDSDHDTAIRLSFIDSVGVPNINPPQYNVYYVSMLRDLKDCLDKHSDTEIEVGLLSVTSQYDRDHCKAWLAEFIRKTPDFSSLTDTLWENAGDLESSLEKSYRGENPENLKLRLLTQLPPKYMMAVQNPKVIRKYIDSYQGNPNDVEKLEALMKKEVLPGLKLSNGKTTGTNIHLERKSLKYMLELAVKDLGLPDQYLQDFRQFLRENSPYYDQSDDNTDHK